MTVHSILRADSEDSVSGRKIQIAGFVMQRACKFSKFKIMKVKTHKCVFHGKRFKSILILRNIDVVLKARL